MKNIKTFTHKKFKFVKYKLKKALLKTVDCYFDNYSHERVLFYDLQNILFKTLSFCLMALCQNV